MKKNENSVFLEGFLFVTYLILFISVVFSFRAISSISIGLILLTAIAGNRRTFYNLASGKNAFFFLTVCSLFFFIQCISLLHSENLNEGLQLLQRRSGIMLIPFAVYSTGNYFFTQKFSKLITCFAAIVFLGSLYCLLITAFHYLSGAPAYLFFYHDLVKPLSQHAIQFSILVFIALLFLIENLKETKLLLSPAFGHSMIAFLSLFLLLLSSKLIISFYIFYLTSIFLRNRINKKRFFATYLIFITAFISIAITPNPIGNRFRSMITGNSLLFEQQKFNPGVYFNGVQFRLLEWRFSFEILNEQKAWIKGVTPADAQSFLDKKYTETNMFTGIPGTQNHGFLGYHTHNQFLQSLLENGLPGLVVFLLICFSLFKMAWGHARHELKWLVTLLIVYCFTDAPFETQYGIVIFTLFPLLFYLTGQNVLKIPIHAKIIGAETPKPIAVKQPN